MWDMRPVKRTGLTVAELITGHAATANGYSATLKQGNVIVTSERKVVAGFTVRKVTTGK